MRSALELFLSVSKHRTHWIRDCRQEIACPGLIGRQRIPGATASCFGWRTTAHRRSPSRRRPSLVWSARRAGSELRIRCCSMLRATRSPNPSRSLDWSGTSSRALADRTMQCWNLSHVCGRHRSAARRCRLEASQDRDRRRAGERPAVRTERRGPPRLDPPRPRRRNAGVASAPPCVAEI